MQIIPISVPTPFYVGDVNVYLIKDDPVTLIDTGPKTDEALIVLRRKLAENGIKFSDIQKIILTHIHEDHCGLTRTIMKESADIEIFIHPWENGHLNGRISSEEQRHILLRTGISEAELAKLQYYYQEFALYTDSLETTELSDLDDEMELEFATGSLKVLHTPGHTPGSCSLIREADRTVIAGDCVIKRISPNPILSPDPVMPQRRFPSLGEQLVSLAKLRSYNPTLVYGGHGEPIIDYEEIFNRYVRGINDRQKKVLSILQNKEMSAFELAKELFAASFDQGVHRFLAISEAAAHLDLAFNENKIGMELKGGVEYYRALI